jgi:putative hydrolase of the HAD superfamily
VNVRGILFDAGDTLFGPIGGRWNPRFDFEEVLTRYHPGLGESCFAEAFEVGNRFLTQASLTPSRDDYHRVVLSELGIHEPSLALLADLSRPLQVPVVEVFPEVVQCLTELRARNIRTALVSDNWAGLEHLLEQLGLLQYFDALVISEVMGCCKPDPRMYRTASDRLGLTPPECLFIDDDADFVLAAINLGYQAVAIDRHRSRSCSEIGAIHDLNDIFRLLGNCCPRGPNSPNRS